MTTDGRSALAIPVPAADPLLARVAAQSTAARRGLPAHLTLLYPFLPAADLDVATTAALPDLLGQQSELEVRFTRCHVRDGFVFLRTEPAEPLHELIARLRRRWPRLRPYDGRFGDTVDAHVTIAMDAPDGAALARAVDSGLPLRARLTEAWLAVPGTGWRLVDRFRFRAAPSS
ncbi:2'-5' RNA ligase family protein [Amycolatopsis viridis]|uniref:2'-5' RNA ligase superfamily protein n=1 Tax=Amycolatopsis viridis TaxID=185678 RepID=A0ABX0SV32_9PSEU|nr:2'-5' RNA ligase family protein [Amycolatopsis viridis]NIH80289.1 hypothetical protein [Amycolatopsis viridis]